MEVQRRLCGRVRKEGRVGGRLRFVAGLDCAFSKDGTKTIAGIVVLRLPDFEVVERVRAVRPTSFPYVPGLLSFREAPACIAAARKVRTKVQLFVVDGQGIAHPRRFGIAAHLGVLFDTATVGCAKSRLVGEHDEPGRKKGSYVLLKDSNPSRRAASQKRIETIGAVLRTRTDVKPVFVSVGHKCSLRQAVRWCLRCTAGYRLPEPTRLADQYVGRLKHGQV